MTSRDRLTGFGPTAVALFLGVLAAGTRSVSANGSFWEPSVGRSTVDPEHDLIQALIREQRFNEAATLCGESFQALPDASGRAAWWAVQASRVASARLMTRQEIDEAAVRRATRPVTSLLESYPEHRRRYFLQAQQAAVSHQAARHDVISAAMFPGNDDVAERALVRITRLLTTIDRLAEAVAAERSRLGARPAGVDAGALEDDLRRLQQTLLVRRVQAALLQSELFDESGPDAVAAASRAEQASREAIERLPVGSTAREELARLRVLALLGMGDAEAADAAVQPLLSSRDPRQAPGLLAAAVEVDLALGRIESASRRVATFYGSDPAEAPASVEMDMAALRLRLTGRSEDEPESGSSNSGVPAWIDLMERRGGAYARRRAEATAIESLRRRDGETALDPSIIAAQGEDWLRRGELQRGGELLASAAEAEQDPEEAVRRAGQAAAALVGAGSPWRAAEVLAEIARGNPDARSAAAVHLQAAVLVAQGDGPDVVDHVDALLRRTIETWPTSEAAVSARRWLARMLGDRGRLVEAAEVATGNAETPRAAERLGEAVDRWREAFKRAWESDGDSATQVGNRFLASAKPIIGDPVAGPSLATAAVLLADRETLAELDSGIDAVENRLDPFVVALRQFRTGGDGSSLPASVPSQRVDDVRRRLMRDGRRHPALRSAVARQLDRWSDESEPLAAKAERALWLGRPKAAVSMFRRAAAESSSPGRVLRSAARLLSDGESTEARRGAVALWEQLASGLPKDTASWHQAKLAACRSLYRLGDTEEAARRAKYILLTSPPKSEETREAYRELITKVERGE